VTDFIFKWIEQGGYFGVFALMLLETVFPPIPSEVIMPLAGVVAARGSLSLPWVIVAGTAGAMVGNMIWYAAAKALGLDRFRPLIERYGRWLTLDWAEIERAHRLFDKHGGSLVFVGRMLPTVRSLVSIPAGLLRMRFVPFVLWSTLGSAIWTTGLALAGWVLGTEFAHIETVLGPLSLAVILGLAGWYVWRLATWRPSKP
jgi:membrane protein DedA with SNARE-associated domain